MKEKPTIEAFFEIDQFYTEVYEYPNLRVIDRVYYEKENQIYFIKVDEPKDLWKIYPFKGQYSKNTHAVANLRMFSHIKVEFIESKERTIVVTLPLMHTEIKEYIRDKMYEIGFRGTIEFMHAVKCGEYILM